MLSPAQNIKTIVRGQWQSLVLAQRKRATLGARGERAAARRLRRKGYHIVEAQARNIYGEVDIIAVDRRTVVFVEVKTRRSHDAGHPAEAVTPEKQRRITKSALAYLKHHQLLETPARFDVVAITWPLDVRVPTIIHYINAFEPTDQYQWFT